MKREWIKKMVLGLMLLGTLGLSACGSGGDDFEGDSEEAFGQGGGDAGQAWGVNSDLVGGSVVGQGDFTGAIFNDGTGVTCGPDGGCIY